MNEANERKLRSVSPLQAIIRRVNAKKNTRNKDNYELKLIELKKEKKICIS